MEGGGCLSLGGWVKSLGAPPACELWLVWVGLGPPFNVSVGLACSRGCRNERKENSECPIRPTMAAGG